jgi:hypothetical protein
VAQKNEKALFWPICPVSLVKKVHLLPGAKAGKLLAFFFFFCCYCCML